MLWGPWDNSDLMSTVSFTMRRRLIRLAAATFTSSHLAKSGWVPFAMSNAWQRSGTQKFREGGWNLRSHFKLSVCGPKFTKFTDDAKDSSYFPLSLPDCLCHVSFRRYSPLSLKVFERQKKCEKLFCPSAKPGNELECIIYIGWVKMTVQF